MIKDSYAESFVGGKPDGRPLISARIVFGAIFIKEQENLADRQMVEYTLENPYVRFFLACPLSGRNRQHQILQSERNQVDRPASR
jgi:hypothetical protein